jgi:hypothetical protein
MSTDTNLYLLCFSEINSTKRRWQKPNSKFWTFLFFFQFSCIFFQFSCSFFSQNDNNLDGLLMDHKKIRSKRDLNSQMFSHIWKAYIFNTYLKQVKCQIQQVQHITVSSTILLCPQLLLINTSSTFPLSTYYGHIMLHSM